MVVEMTVSTMALTGILVLKKETLLIFEQIIIPAFDEIIDDW